MGNKQRTPEPKVKNAGSGVKSTSPTTKGKEIH